MLITNLLVVGSIAYVGAKSLPMIARRWRLGLARAHSGWRGGGLASAQTYSQDSSLAEGLQRGAGRADEATPVQVEVLSGSAETAHVGLAELDAQQRFQAAATIAFWLAIGGYLLPLLTLASIPFTIVSTVPILEASARSLFVERRMRPAVLNAALIIASLVTERYLTAATVSLLHHTFRRLSQQTQQMLGQVTAEMTPKIMEGLGDLVAQATGSPPRTVWAVRENVEVQMPYSTLAIGDLIIVSRGEFVPADGVVTAGSGTVNLVMRTGHNAPIAVRQGERVYARSFVAEGRLQIQIEQFIQA